MNSKYIQKFKTFLLCLSLLSGWQLLADWSVALDLSVVGQDASPAPVSINSSGHAVATWIRSNGAHDIVQSAFFNGTSWSTPVNLSAPGQQAFLPAISLNDDDHAMAVWTRSDGGSHYYIQASFFDGTSWSMPADLATDGEGAYSPQISLNSSDHAVAVWQTFDGSHNIIQASLFDGADWSSVADLSDLAQPARNPQISLNNSGNAFAVWERYNGSLYVIQTSFFDGDTWATPVDLSNTSFAADNSRISLNDLGKAVVVWKKYGGSNITQAAFFDGTSWSSPTDLSTGEQDAGDPQLSKLNSSNKVIAGWKESTDTGTVLYASFFDGVNWSLRDVSADGQYISSHQIALNDSDNAYAIWGVYDDTIIRTSFFDGTDWSSPTEFTQGGQSSPRISLNNAGNAMATWLNLNDSNYIVQATSYESAPPAPDPAQDLLGVKRSSEFVFQTVYSNHLAWSPSSSESVTVYHIYRDDVLIGTVSAEDVLVFNDRNIDWRSSYRYSIKAATDQEVESSALTVEIYP